MAILFGNSTTGTGSASPVQFTLNVDEVDVFVGVSVVAGTPQCDSVSVGATSASEIRRDQSNEAGNDVETTIWLARGVSQGNQTVSATLSAIQDACVGAVCVSGLDGSTPTQNANGATGATGAPSVTITSQTDDVVFAVLAVRGTGNFTWTDETQLWNAQLGNIRGEAAYEAGDTSVVMDVDQTATSPWSMSGVSLIPDAGTPAVIWFRQSPLLRM